MSNPHFTATRRRPPVRAPGAQLMTVLLVLILVCSCSEDPTIPPTVIDAHDLHEMPGSLAAMIPEGGPNPAPIDLYMSNTGTVELDYSIDFSTVSGISWLDVSPTSGTLAPETVSGAAKVLSLTVSFDVEGTVLTPGTYTGSIVISGTSVGTGSPAIGSPARISVNLTITATDATIVIDDDAIEIDIVTPTQWTATASGPAGRTEHSAVWTGRQMIVWGGSTTGLPGDVVDEGGIYQGQIDSWELLAGIRNVPTARLGHTAVWTGNEMIIWGGTVADGSATGTGSTYSPADGWTVMSASALPLTHHAAVWTGQVMLVWGSVPSAWGGAYDPVADTWSPMSTVGMPTCTDATAVWTGRELLVWGDGASGGLYEPAVDNWRPLEGQGYIEPSNGHSAVWTGREMIVWGGRVAGIAVGTGACYDPYSDRWGPMSTIDAPAARSGHRAVWSGGMMIVWGGMDDTGSDPGQGACYNPDINIWTAIPTLDQPTGYDRHSAVWTGQNMIVWGGFDGLSATGSGAVFE